MNIVVQSGCSVEDFFIFNKIPYTLSDFWKTKTYDNGTELSGYFLEGNVSDSLVLLSVHSFSDILSNIKTTNELVNFINEGNKVWVIDNHGVDITLKYIYIKDKIKQIDSLLKKNSIILFHDAIPSEHAWFASLKNIKNLTFPIINWLYTLPRIFHGSLEKNVDAVDFMLTTVLKKNRFHRKTLYQKLNKKPELLSKGLVNFAKASDTTSVYVGEHPDGADVWRDGHPSMDLYKNANLEIVPETLYKTAYFTTEKTLKPIATKTPFLIVSNKGYLQHLKNLGFRTFNSLIDESYDNQHRIEDRVKSIIILLEDIIKNGSKDFYLQSKEILDYNFKHLSYIAGSHRYQNDLYMFDILKKEKILDF